MSIETVNVTTFKKWPFADDFEITISEHGKVESALCKYCSEVNYIEYIRKAKEKNIKGSALKSLENFRKEVTYIHRLSFARHVGDYSSMHNWCKKKILPEYVITVPKRTAEASNQERIDEPFLNSNTDHYSKFFRTVLFMLEEELAFTKLKPLVELQRSNGMKLLSGYKVNEVAAAEMAEILSEVVNTKVKEITTASKYAAISGDASEARKTSEEKELVFCKLVGKGYQGYVPVTFLLKCQKLKDFGGGTSEGTFKAMIDALEAILPQDEFLKKLVCATADGASVNFGKHTGALRRLCALVGWDIPQIHCMNHKLELAMKDSYAQGKTFTDLRDMLDVLFRLFKNSGRSWRMYQLVAKTLNLSPLRFCKVGGTRFQAHSLNALSSFLRNFVITILYAENVEGQGSGKDSLVTKEMYPRFVGFRKKWLQVKFLASANMFFRVLSETAHLYMNMESDAVLIYELYDSVNETISNLKLIKDEKESNIFPPNVKVIKETIESGNFLMRDTITVSAKVASVPEKRLREIEKMDENERKEAEKNIVVIKEKFVLNNAEQGKQKLEDIKTSLIPEIIENIQSRFDNLNTEKEYRAFKIFDVTEWSQGEETEDLMQLDNERIDILADRFKSPLGVHNFDLKEAKKEWQKVKRTMKSKLFHLKEHQQMMWCRLLTHSGHLYPNVSLLVEIMLVMLTSSAVVERGFSALRRNLRENRLSMTNMRLNQILTIKINVPCLRKIIKKCDEVIIKECVERFYEKKNWRWSTNKQAPNVPVDTDTYIYGPPPTKKTHIDLTNNDVVDNEVSNFSEYLDDASQDEKSSASSDEEDWYID